MMHGHSVPPSLLSALSDSVSASLGLHFPKERLGDLARGVASAAHDLGQSDAEKCARWLLSAPLTRSDLEILATHLTVGETYFFREGDTLRFFIERIVPEILRNRQDTTPLRIWSAGCCTGEEPYSIAMLLHSLVPEAASNVTIIATDINPRFLRKASQAVYGEWSFRQTPPDMRRRYFHKRPDRKWELDFTIRNMVRFSRLNLAVESGPLPLNDCNALDVIFCRNVLMYFSAQRAKEVARNFCRSLAEGGWLIAGAAEISNATFSDFHAVQFPDGTVYRKGAAVEPPLPAYRDEITVKAIEPRKSASPELPPPNDNPLPPQNTDDFLATARACANEGRLEDAASWCRRAIVTDRTNPIHHYLLSAVQREIGDTEAAMDSLRRVLFLDHDFVLAHFAMANLALSRGRRREAERHFENALAALRTHPNEEVLPESDGMTAGRLTEVITSLRGTIR